MIHTVQTQGCGVSLYFSPEFMRKNQKPTQTVTSGISQSEFDVIKCQVKTLRYYLRCMSEHRELRKGRRRLFIPIRDNNTGNDLVAAIISRWICITIVDSHGSLDKDKSPLINPRLPSQSQNRHIAHPFCQILVISKMSYELFVKAFVTELKFLDRN